VREAEPAHPFWGASHPIAEKAARDILLESYAEQRRALNLRRGLSPYAYCVGSVTEATDRTYQVAGSCAFSHEASAFCWHWLAPRTAPIARRTGTPRYETVINLKTAKALAVRRFAGTSTPIVAKDRRRPDPVGDRRLDIQIKLTDEPRDGKPAVSFDCDAGMRPQAASASGDRQAITVESRSCRLTSIPTFAGQLQ
jgi:hypothetical protein